MATTANKQGNTGSAALWRVLLPHRRTPGDAPTALSQVIDRVRQRWRARQLLNGLAWSLLAGVVAFTVAAWLLDFWHYDDAAVWGLRIAMLVILAALLWRFVLQPLRRRVSDTRVAMYLEEHEPALGSMLLSAVDARHAEAPDSSPQLVERLVEGALDACARLDYGDAVEQRNLRAALARFSAAGLAVVALVLLQPDLLRYGAKALLKPWSSAQEYSPYRIAVHPGDIEIQRGGDQLIRATIAGYDGDEVELLTSRDDGASWQALTMTAGNAAGVYETFLFDLEQPMDYRVRAVGLQTPTFRVSVADIPAIETIALHYRFPDYTLMAPETTTGSGDITALRGTRVDVEITPTIDIPGGELLLDDGRRLALVRADDGAWRGEIMVQENAAYRVTLQRASGIPVDASAEFRITALDDRHPSVSILSPGKDTRVSMIEEPLMRIRANDDQGIASLQLVLSVNGEDEQVVQLLQETQAAQRNPQVEAEHVVFLEDLGLQAGDLVSYYVKAEDRAPAAQAKIATSDIFFYQVRPFSTNYHNAEQSGGGGGGGGQGGERQGHLSDQQKQFVIATFKMIRDRDQYSEESWRENLDLLATAEARIRDRVEAILRRIGSRPLVLIDPRYQVVLTELPQAVEAMTRVEMQLAETEVEEALADAQVALKHLQRADAAFRDINVSMANRGGGAANAGSEDLANLFRLEMDKLRNQYETVRRGQQQQPPQQQVIDETLERLRELAQRQQREVERQIRRQQQATGSEADANQLALAEELEEMARQLEKLTREQPNQRLQQSISQMRGAAEAMRGAATNGGGGGGIAQARQASDQLREAERLLDQGRQQKLSEEIERRLHQAERAEKNQATIQREVAELDETWNRQSEARLNQIEERKRVLADDLASLESELGKLTIGARKEQPEVSESLQQAIGAAREHRLQDRIGRTRTMVQLGQNKAARNNEAEIQKGIGRLREHIESALASVGEPGGRKLERSLEQMRALAREMRFLRERQAGSGGAAGGAGNADAQGPLSREAIEAMQRQLDSIAERSSELGRELIDQGVAAGDIDPVLEQIKQWSSSADGDADPAASERALLALMDLEYRLRQRLDDRQAPGLLISDPAELPRDYEELIAEYFRKLSTAE